MPCAELCVCVCVCVYVRVKTIIDVLPAHGHERDEEALPALILLVMREVFLRPPDDLLVLRMRRLTSHFDNRGFVH